MHLVGALSKDGVLVGDGRSLVGRALLVSVALTFSGLVAPAAASAGGEPPEPARAEPSAPVLRSAATVTLLTGDRVTLRPGPDGRPSIFVENSDGEPAAGYAVRNDHGRITVIPHAVERLVPGVLDPALFDVTGLIEMGYDDAHRADLPVVVRADAGAQTLVTSGFRATRTLAVVDATAGHIEKSHAKAFTARMTADRSAGPTKIWLDSALRADAVVPSAPSGPESQASEAAPLDAYLDQIAAPTAWRRGLDGRGVKVAILDSGIDTGHPALAGKVTATQDFTGEGPQDDLGRGTQIASLVAGNGAGSDGARKGVAPGARLLSGKILDAAGDGTVSELIAAMQWAVDQHADLVNIGLGARASSQGDDLLAEAVDRMTAQSGALFVVAAGDDGSPWFSSPFTVETPGTAASALTVGALDPAGNRAGFTSMGPTYSWRQKPEIAAPGTGILGARSGARDGELYAMGFGTSRSTALVAGSAALLLQQHPELSWQQLKARLSSSAVASDGLFTSWYGSGRVNLDTATSPSGLVPSVGVLDFGAIRHPDNSPQKRTLTLTNPTAEPVTLTFADHEVTLKNKIAPESAVVVTPATLTVPAGATVDATVTFDPAGLNDIVGDWLAVSDNLWTGALDVKDTAGKRRLRLALNAFDEPPVYDVSVRVLDRNGKPVHDGAVNVYNKVDGHFNQLFLDDQGRGVNRLTPGVYSAYSWVPTADTTTFAIEENVTVGQDTSFTLDARKAIKLSAPAVEGRPTTVTAGAFTYTSGRSKDELYGDETTVTPEDLATGRFYVTPTEAATTGFAEALSWWRLEPAGKTSKDTPDVYHVFQTAGRFGTPLVKPVDRKAQRDMARVETTYGTAWGGTERMVTRVGQSTLTGIAWGYRAPVATPSRQVELLSAGPGITWSQCDKVPATGIAGLCDNPYPVYERGQKLSPMLETALHPQIVGAEFHGGSFRLQVGAADGHHVGAVDSTVVGGQQLAVYRDDKLIADVPEVDGDFPVPDGAARWRVEHRWNSAAVPSSGEARTTWEFGATSTGDPAADPVGPPMIRPMYDPAVAADGSTRAWRPMPFGLTLSYLDGKAVRAKSAKLWLSADRGRHWSPAPLARTSEGYKTMVAPWFLLPGKSLSVRTAVVDTSGNSVDQTVLDLVLVR